MPGGPGAADRRGPSSQALGAAPGRGRTVWPRALRMECAGRFAVVRRGSNRRLRFGAVRRFFGVHATGTMSCFYTDSNIADVTSLRMICPENGGFFGIFFIPPLLRHRKIRRGRSFAQGCAVQRSPEGRLGLRGLRNRPRSADDRPGGRRLDALRGGLIAIALWLVSWPANSTPPMTPLEGDGSGGADFRTRTLHHSAHRTPAR